MKLCTRKTPSTDRHARDHERAPRSGIRPYTPLSTLKPIAEGIWVVDGPIIEMRFGPVSLPFPTRMVVIRLQAGGLWLWSPTAPTPELFAEIDALGPVEHLVSPNKVHYASIPAWQQRYPQARAWASPGVRDRARSQKIEIDFAGDLEDQAPQEWAGEIEQLVFRGSRFMDELVFFHRASSTLILTDLVIALERERVRSRLLRWIFVAVGATWPGQTPRELRPTFWGRQAQARGCYERMLAFQPRQVLFAHGRCYLEDATERLERAFAWLR